MATAFLELQSEPSVPLGTWRHYFANFVIASGFRIPELRTLQEATSPSCVEIDSEMSGSGAPHTGATLDPSAFSIRFPELAHFHVSRQSGHLRVVCRSRLKDNWSASATLRHLFLDQVMPRVLALSGEFMLHAGVVKRGDDSFLIAGPSGAGKSTLCAALDVSGDELLSDDGARLIRFGHGWAVWPTYPSLRLWPDSTDAVLPAGHERRPMAGYSQKLRLTRSHAPHGQPIPIRALFVVNEQPTSSMMIERMGPAAACMSVVSNSFQFQVSTASSLRVFGLAQKLTQAVPVYQLSYPRRFDDLSEVCRCIREIIDTSHPRASLHCIGAN